LNTISRKQNWITKKVIAWSLFDFANSSFATIVTALVYAIYFKKVVANNLPIADLYWSIGINISMIIVAFISPVLGAAADYYNNKKTYLIFFTILCIATTGAMYFVVEGMIFEGILLFILANIGFQAGLGFYDAFLKEVTLPENYNKVSSFGYAVGYAGSLFALAAIFIFKEQLRLTFPSCSIIFLIFSIPLIWLIKEKKDARKIQKFSGNFITTGLKRVSETFKHIKEYENIKWFLLSYFLYIDGVNTIIFFSGNYAQTTLSFSIEELILFFVIVQITALGGSFILGYAADKTSTKKSLMFTLLAWSIISFAVYFATSKLMFMIIGGFAGIFLGSTQALSRSFLAKLIPEEKKTEFFGFYSLFEKTSTILGPLAFGLISWLTSNQRYAALAMILFFVSGYLLLIRVKEK
jgi:MFS transporter, UMF1 family